MAVTIHKHVDKLQISFSNAGISHLPYPAISSYPYESFGDQLAIRCFLQRSVIDMTGYFRLCAIGPRSELMGFVFGVSNSLRILQRRAEVAPYLAE